MSKRTLHLYSFVLNSLLVRKYHESQNPHVSFDRLPDVFISQCKNHYRCRRLSRETHVLKDFQWTQAVLAKHSALLQMYLE
jgi:hypothetical protein